MTPSLNPALWTWICTDTGGGPICRGSLSDSWTRPIPSCDAAIWSTRRATCRRKRALASTRRPGTHTFFKNLLTEVWTLSPTGAGPSVKVRGSWKMHYVYPIPGDRSTRVLTITGADWQVTAKGYGLVFHDTGLVRYVPGTDDVIDFTHGPTDSDHGNWTWYARRLHDPGGLDRLDWHARVDSVRRLRKTKTNPQWRTGLHWIGPA